MSSHRSSKQESKRQAEWNLIASGYIFCVWANVACLVPERLLISRASAERDHVLGPLLHLHQRLDSYQVDVARRSKQRIARVQLPCLICHRSTNPIVGGGKMYLTLELGDTRSWLARKPKHSIAYVSWCKGNFMYVVEDFLKGLASQAQHFKAGCISTHHLPHCLACCCSQGHLFIIHPQVLNVHLLHELSKAEASMANGSSGCQWGPYLKQLPRSYTTLCCFSDPDIAGLQEAHIMHQHGAHHLCHWHGLVCRSFVHPCKKRVKCSKQDVEEISGRILTAACSHMHTLLVYCVKTALYNRNLVLLKSRVYYG
eukprot:scaffold201489_cov17-Tisochrysis_lutea.AAC.2